MSINSKSQITKSKQILNSNAPNKKLYDLEDRTFKFAQDCREFIGRLPRTIAQIEDAKQLVRSSGSVGANYIEANESFSKRDFVLRAKICRKETKESRYWILLLMISDSSLESKRMSLIQEATELTKILNAIIEKST